MTTREALDWVRRAPTLLAGLERMDALLSAARCDGPLTAALLASAVADPADQLTAIAALHAAAVADTDTASTVVVPLLDSTVPFLREHAAWALASSSRLPMAISGLSAIAAAGGFTGTLAEATLEAWGELPLDEDESPRSHRTDGQHDPVARDCRSAPRLTVAQLFLHADIDGRLLHAGQGDTGGIATLLVHLGDALLAEGTVDRVLTLSRGRPGEARIPADLAERGHHYLSVPLPGPILHAPDAWPLRLPARRGLRSLLRAAGRVDVLHLRMADVGSWAAADVAREFGIHTVLTLAPDPHALIAAREASGTLTRANFGAADHAEHLVFRVRLLRELAEQASHLVVFPRPNLRRDVRDLLHLDPLHLDPDSALSLIHI